MSKSNLLPHHRQQLQASAIDDQVIAERGYQTVNRPTAGDDGPRKLLKRLGIPNWARDDDARFSGLLIPVYRATGELISWQYKPDRPPNDPQTGKPRRYANQAGRANVIDVHPRWKTAITDPNVPLWITEGIKKADSLTSRGICCVALYGVFNWRSTLGTLGDWEDIPLKGRVVVICFDSDARTNPNVARAMQRLGAWLKSKNAGQVIYVMPPALNGSEPKKGVDDFFAAGGTVEQLFGAMQSSPPSVADDPGEPEGLIVEALVSDLLDGTWTWCPALGSGRGVSGWLKYHPGDGCWTARPDAELAEEVRAWLKSIYLALLAQQQDAVKHGASGDDVKRLASQAEQWRQRLRANVISNLVRLAQGLLLSDAGDFDSHPDLLNAPNGVIDLRSGKLLDHDPSLKFTQVTRARYTEGAAHEDWDKALEAIPGDSRDWLALRFGQAITGHVPPDDGVLVMTGKGENGKSTVTSGMEGALGGYFRWISDRAVTGDKSQHPTELMDFRGARLAVIEELPDEAKLNMHHLKKITGAVISARYCGQDSSPYETSHAFMINTNSLPLVTETDHGSWRRMVTMHWPYRYYKDYEMPDPPGEYDRPGESGLRERLRTGDDGRREAVLAWLVRHAKRFYDGLRDDTDSRWEREPETFGRPPERLERDHKTWRASANPLAGYVEEELTGDPGGHVWVVDFRDAFTERLKQYGHNAWSARTLAERLPDVCRAAGIMVEPGQVETGKTRGTRLSRPPSYTLPPVPGHYKVWLGIRYKTAAERAGEAVAEDPPQASDQAVTRITRSPGDSSRGNSTQNPPDDRVIRVTEPLSAYGQPAVKYPGDDLCWACGGRVNVVSMCAHHPGRIPVPFGCPACTEPGRSQRATS